jgi:NAD(P)-dependent dehydrogenase (short-subunit alcohol dehydrogenase family)
MHRPDRLIFLSSGMHEWGSPDLGDLDWTGRPWDGAQAYSDSKLFDTTLALALARRWPDVRANGVSPGWVATKMGGPGAPGDLALAHVTQAWLAVADDERALVSGRLFHHQAPVAPSPHARDPRFQDALVEALATLTGVALPPQGTPRTTPPRALPQ